MSPPGAPEPILASAAPAMIDGVAGRLKVVRSRSLYTAGVNRKLTHDQPARSAPLRGRRGSLRPEIRVTAFINVGNSGRDLPAPADVSIVLTLNRWLHNARCG